MDIIKNHLEAIPGIAIYPIISFVIFFVVFVLLFLHTFSIDKDKIDEMKHIPLDDDTRDHSNSNQESTQ
jgi:hypothetical protein